MHERFAVLLLSLLLILPARLQAQQANLPPYDDPMIQNVTAPYETIIYAHEQIKLIFRNTGHGKISFKQYKIESMQIRYQVHDLENQLVMQGTETANKTYNGKALFQPSVMIDLTLPDSQPTGWFRVTASLVGMDMENKEHVFGSTWVDLAVVPEQTQSKPDRFFGLSGPFGAGQPTPALTQYNQPVLQRMGAGSLRVFTNWSSIQSDADQPLNFRRLDRLVAVCRDADVQVLMTLNDTPDFAALPADSTLRVPLSKPIPQQKYWESFVTQMASHFHGQVIGWEVLNETNGLRQWPNGDPQSYAAFYMRSYQLIRQQDPTVRITNAGTTGMKPQWLKAVAEHGAGPMIDVVAVHPYRYPDAPPEYGVAKDALGYGQTSLIEDFRQVAQVTQQMPTTLSGYRREIWSTESGYNTMLSFPPLLHHAVTLKEQAQLLVRTMALARTLSVDRFFWWRFYDTLGGGLGILHNQDYDYMPKPAVVTYAVLQRQLGGAKTVSLVGDHGLEDVFDVKATFESKPDTHVIWSVKAPRDVCFKSQSPVNITDMMGVTHQAQPHEGIITLSLNTSPIYLQTTAPVVLFKP